MPPCLPTPPAAVSLLAPLWVVNSTSLGIDAVIVPIEAPPLQGGGAADREKSATKQRRRAAPEALRCRAGGAAAACSPVAFTYMAQQTRHLRFAWCPCRADALRTIETDNRDRAQQVEYRGRRFLAPSSLELLSYPMPSYLLASGSQQQLSGAAGASSSAEQAQRQRQQRRQQYGVRLRVAGSGWTPPLALDAAELAPAGNGGGAQQVQPQQASVVCPWRCCGGCRCSRSTAGLPIAQPFWSWHRPCLPLPASSVPPLSRRANCRAPAPCSSVHAAPARGWCMRW